MMTSAFGIEELTEPVYVEIADYYDNRKAVVTLTADDWNNDYEQSFEDMCSVLTAKRIYHTVGIVTDDDILSGPLDWTKIQYWIDQGYAEAASHSRTHPPKVPYSDPESEIGGSKQDILTNLTLPAHFSYGSTEYVYSWIEPRGISDNTIRQKLGEHKYLADRRVSIDDTWASWDSTNDLFSRIGYSTIMGWDGMEDIATLNSKFESVYDGGGIYHIMVHPFRVNWQPGQYADSHTDYISGRLDVWYVNFGLLYLYRWIDTQNVIQITSTGSLQDKVFKINMSSTDRQNYGAKYPVTYVFDIPPSWTNAYVNYRFRETDPWTTMETKTSSDFFNGINAVRFDFLNHKAYVSIGFDDISNEIYLQILPEDNQPRADFTASPTSGLAPLTVSFTDNSTSYDEIDSWDWDFGDGENSTVQNPTHVYEQEGLYTVSLTVYEAGGDNDIETKIDYIDVNQPPVADANGLYTGTEGVPITFDGSGSHDPDGTILSYLWNFGDGEIDTEQNPTHTYTQNGSYTVTLTVTDDESATDTDTTAATVADTNPTADFLATLTNGLEPLTVSFTDQSTSYDEIASWTWDFGDGEIDTEQNPTHTYIQDGTYTVTLTVYESDGNSATETKADYIIVSDAEPIADFTASPTYGPEPLTVSFTDNSTSYDEIDSWDWDFGDGENSTEQNPIHTYESAGLYTVSLTVLEADGNNHAETKFPYIIVEDSVPTANFTYSPPNPLEGNIATFDASGSTGYDSPLSYSWVFGDGAFGEEVSPTHNYMQDGNYLVTLAVTDADNSTDSTSQTITVADKHPFANFNATPTSGPEPLQVNFTDLSTSYDGITSWTWNFGDEEVSLQQNPTHVYTTNGTYTVSLTVLEEDGNSYVETKVNYITVIDTAPLADFSYLPNPATLTIDFTDQSTSYDELVSWTWDFGDGKTSMKQNPTHKFPDSSTFNVSLTVTDADGSTDTITKQVSVLNVAPIADFSIVSSPKPTINENITFLDQSSDPDGVIESWSWDLGDGTTYTSQNVTHRYLTIGTFIVNLTVSDDDGENGTISKSITIYDVVAPITVDDYDGLWHTSNFTINLNATDDLGEVQTIYYRINNGSIMSVQADGQPFIFVEGYNKLEYWSVDLAGNEEAHQIIPDVKLDKTNPTANAGLDQIVDEDAPMTFDGSASYDNIGITSYTWAFFDWTPQNLTDVTPTYNFTIPDTYIVTLTVMDSAGNSATDTVVIIVIDITKPTANAGDDLVVHEDTLVTFNGSGSKDNVEIVSYNWTFIDVTPQTLLGVNSTYIFDIPSVYNVTLTVSDAQGNLATDAVTITVIDASWPAADAGPDQIVNEDSLVTLNGLGSFDNVGIIRYIWTFIDGTLQTMFGVNPSHIFETPGMYTVTLNVSDAEGYHTTDNVTVTVLDITPPIIDAGSYTTVVADVPVNFDASGSSDNVGIVSYKWDFGDGAVENSTIPSVIYTYANPRVYMVILTVIDEAGNMNASTISVVVNRDTDGDLIANHIDTDDDNDEMPDDWEILHGLNPLDPSDASLDFDGDGLSNLTEYQIGSDPNAYTSPSPFPLFVVLVIAIIGFIISLGILFMRKL